MFTAASQRDQAAIADSRLTQRLDAIVPTLMDREGIDAWVLVAREYNEDPVVRTMLPATWLSARRRTILLFVRGDSGVDRLSVSRYGVDGLFEGAWDPLQEPNQWVRLARLLHECDPASIAISTSPTFAVADGLSLTEAGALLEALPEHLAARIVSGERLAVGWLETRVADEVDQMRENCAVAHSILRAGLSSEAIVPGETTTEDLVWWLRQRTADLGLGTWFHPTVDVQRGTAGGWESFADRPEDVIIGPGDLVHIDFGIEYLNLATDQQQHAYVLGENEVEPPTGLASALAIGNQLQDILMGEFVTGRTGNEMLVGARAAAAEAGIDGLIYSHPIGYHGHGSGPTIGLWDSQEGVPGIGEYPLYPDTAYSIELMVKVLVPEWGGRQVRIMLEEDAFFDGDTISFLDGRQTKLWTV